MVQMWPNSSERVVSTRSNNTVSLRKEAAQGSLFALSSQSASLDPHSRYSLTTWQGNALVWSNAFASHRARLRYHQ